MKLKIRKQLFFYLDWVMPLWLKLIPYQIGFFLCKRYFEKNFQNSHLWVRNSVSRKTLVFGLSDLDLTLLTDYKFDQKQFNFLCKKVKKLVPFMGEVNVYQKDHLDFVAKTINTFELERDIVLKKHIQIQTQLANVDKVVFLLRMLRSDKDLLKGEHHHRQNKWRDHLQMLNLPLPQGLIDSNYIIRQISQFFPNQEMVFKTLGTWLANAPWRDDLYHDHFGEPWKFLNPHLYLWFEKDELISTNVPNDFEKKVLERQIDWELFGLYTQRSWLDQESIKHHINRLQKSLEFYQILSYNIEHFRRSMN